MFFKQSCLHTRVIIIIIIIIITIIMIMIIIELLKIVSFHTFVKHVFHLEMTRCYYYSYFFVNRKATTLFSWEVLELEKQLLEGFLAIILAEKSSMLMMMSWRKCGEFQWQKRYNRQNNNVHLHIQYCTFLVIATMV